MSDADDTWSERRRVNTRYNEFFEALVHDGAPDEQARELAMISTIVLENKRTIGQFKIELLKAATENATRTDATVDDKAFAIVLRRIIEASLGEGYQNFVKRQQS